jgi:hypothetical protein
MKQGQQVRGGRRRQEVEKTWRRRPVERGKLGPFSCRCPGRGDAEGGETSREEPARSPTTSVGGGIVANDFGRRRHRRPLGERSTL